MPRYEVNHVLGAQYDEKVSESDRRTFRPGDIVTDKQLKAAGFDIDFLTKPKPGFPPAIILQKGSEYDGVEYKQSPTQKSGEDK